MVLGRETQPSSSGTQTTEFFNSMERNHTTKTDKNEENMYISLKKGTSQ